MKKTLFISDLHLEASHISGTALFLSFLDKIDANVDTVYILGDLFETWVGDDDQPEFSTIIINALKNLTNKGIKIFILHGNRDFLIGKNFLKASGCKLLPDETVISLYNTSALIMHGDTLCIDDIKYLKARKILRQPFLLWLFSFLPLKFRQNFALKLRKKSQQHVNSTAYEIMDVTQNEVERVMQKHNIHVLIHGHTHRLATHEFEKDGTNMTRIVLGAWHTHGNMLVWYEDGKRELLLL